MSKTPKPVPESDTSGTNRPFNEYDDDVNDPNDLPPAYEPAQIPPVNQGSRPSSSAPHHAPTHAAQGYPGAQYHAQQWPQQGPAQFAPFQQQHQYQQHQQHTPRAPFNYPPGYYCNQCLNTGIKTYNGHPCGTCERAFGRQAGHVQYAPPGTVPLGGVTYMAGDPRIGGRLCGNCKGRGVRSSLFGMIEEQCESFVPTGLPLN